MKLPDFNILPVDEKPESVRLWRIRQALISCSAWSVIAFFILPALIGLPFVLPMVGQVAWASDTDKLNAKLKDIEVRMLAQSIYQACEVKAQSQAKGLHSPYWQRQVRELKEQYFNMTGQSFELPPSC